MNRSTIIYSLSTRGLYSELFNLCLAVVYAQKKRLALRLNTCLWNSRVDRGWDDYFEPTVDQCNNAMAAQDRVYTNEKPWIGKIYYDPKAFCSFYFRFFLNRLYQWAHPTHLLTKDVFGEMRSEPFLRDTLGDDAFGLMAASFRRMYVLNRETSSQIEQRKRQLQLPDVYLGVHIRRGDKIATHEMHDIHLDQYVQAILQHKAVSHNVYIATDDVSVVDYVRQKTGGQGINIFYNSQNKGQGFDESTFNHASKEVRKEETLNVLLDMDVLVHSTFFIGTYTSNLSRVVPFFLGLDRCVSLDSSWNVINSANGM